MPKYRRKSMPLMTPYALPPTSSLDTDNDAEDDKFDPNVRKHVILGRNRYVYRNTFQDKTTLNIRVITGKMRFTKKGVSLSSEEWKKLKEQLYMCKYFLVSDI